MRLPWGLLSDAFYIPDLTAEKIPRQQLVQLRLSLPYPLEGLLRRELQQAGATLLQAVHGQRVSLALQLPADQSHALQQRINDLTQGRAIWSEEDV